MSCKFLLIPFLAAFALNGQDVGPIPMETGPFHRPVIVGNEFGTFDTAVLVYSDSQVEMYAPDPSNAYMVQQELAQYGTFETMLYVYAKRQESTLRYFVQVDASKRTFIINPGAIGPQTHLTFTTAPAPLRKAVLTIANILQHEIDLRSHR